LAKLKIDDQVEELSITGKMAQRLSADIGDMVYVCDARIWLGGLRSTHARISSIHERETSTLYIAPSLVRNGNLIVKRRHRIEKIL
jgi:hypothetical protein